MAPLTQDRRGVVEKAGNQLYQDPVAADTKIHAGGAYCLDAAGNAVPADADNTLVSRAMCMEGVDNTGGAAGAKNVKGKKGVFNFLNSAGADEITRAEIEDDCYFVDDQTVAKTDDTGARPLAGKIVDIDGSKVFVEIK